MRSIIISGKNLDPNSAPFNDTYKYVFPQGSVKFEDCEIAVNSVSLWFAWYNISATLGNNKFSYVWNSATPVTVDVTIPDGSYTIEDLNTFLQFTFIQNKHYLIDGSGNYVYYAELLWNPTAYLIELISYPLPVTTTYTLPPGATWALPATAATPQIVFPTAFGTLVGFDAGTYPSAAQSSIYNVLAQNIDKMEPISSIVIGCSMLQNTLAIPASTLYSMPISDHNYGEIAVQVGQLTFVPIIDGFYNDFSVQFFDQAGNRFYLRDSDISVFLVIRKRSEILAINKR